MLKQQIVNMGIATKIADDRYESIRAVLSIMGSADFWLMPSLVLWILPVDSETPSEAGLHGTFVGRFNKDVNLRVLGEELTYAVEEICFLAYCDHPEPSTQEAAPARIAVESVAKFDGEEITLTEVARRRGFQPAKKRVPWSVLRYGRGGKQGGSVTRSVVSCEAA